MKKVDVTYFKENGKYYTKEDFEISEELLGGTKFYWQALKDKHRIETMFMLVQDSGDNKEPYIVPHLFNPIINNFE